MRYFGLPSRRGKGRARLSIPSQVPKIPKDIEKLETLPPVHPFIGKLSDAPPELIDNVYIKRGYRINYTSFRLVMRSLLLLHNESVNIWSHLIGVFVWLLLVFYTLVLLSPGITHSPSEELFTRIYGSNMHSRHSSDDVTEFLEDVLYHNLRSPASRQNVSFDASFLDNGHANLKKESGRIELFEEIMDQYRSRLLDGVSPFWPNLHDCPDCLITLVTGIEGVREHQKAAY